MAISSHAIDLGIKALLFAVYTIGTIGGILAVVLTGGCSKKAREFTKNSILLLADVLTVMGVDLGCVLGPIAYKIEDYIRIHITEKMIPGSLNRIKIKEK